jgi:N-acetyl-anhydromuramyl-L-alanine amidase AmpD
MKITNIIKQLKWKNSNGSMKKEIIDTIVVHHDDELRPDRYNSLVRYQKEAEYHASKGWGHISYHFIIDNTGAVFQALPETEVAYHCGNLVINRKSIAIKFDGKMETQKPTDAQLKAYKELIKYLTSQRPDLPKVVVSSIKGHRDMKPTACPGKNLYPLIRKIK